jgi:hypothetical protein
VLDARLGAAGDDDARTRRGEPAGDGEADAGRGSAHDGKLAVQLDFHATFLGLKFK